METKAWRREDHMKTKAEIGVMLSQAKEPQELPATSGSSDGKAGFSLRAFREGVTLPTT